MPTESDSRPNVLIVMTDEERYPPPYEYSALAEFRRSQLPARHSLLESGLELQRHYVASTACLPSRTSLFTGQYPSLHGVRHTDGLAKPSTDPSMFWLDPNTVPTMGDWFRAAGYRTQYRGKWHLSHPDLLVPGTHRSLTTNDRDGNVWSWAAETYRRADRLEPFGFGGWIGAEPHGPSPANTGFVRDGIFADQVCEMLGELAQSDGGPWLAVASFVNPHDIAFSGMFDALGFPPIDEAIPEIPEAPSQSESLLDRPTAQREFRAVWPKMLFDQPADMAYRRFYHWLHVLVDAAIGRVLDALDASGMREDTIVVFTSDHGDQLGAHGGLQQKWYQAYEETLRVPMVVCGPGIDTSRHNVAIPTSHIDVLPTLLGLVGANVDELAPTIALDHVETRPLPGRDLSPLLRGACAPEALEAPVYFTSEDQMTRGMRTQSQITGTPFEPVREPANLESVVTTTSIGKGGRRDLWKLTRYYESDTDEGAVPEEWEAYNLSDDPQERANLAADGLGGELGDLRDLLAAERAHKRLVPTMGKPDR